MLILFILAITSFFIITPWYLWVGFWLAMAIAYYLWGAGQKGYAVGAMLAAILIFIRPWRFAWLASLAMPTLPGTSTGPEIVGNIAPGLAVGASTTVAISGNGLISSLEIDPQALPVERGQVYTCRLASGWMIVDLQRVVQRLENLESLMPDLKIALPSVSEFFSENMPKGPINPLDIIQVIVPGYGPQKLAPESNELVIREDGQLAFILQSRDALWGASFVTIRERGKNPVEGPVVLVLERKDNLPEEAVPESNSGWEGSAAVPLAWFNKIKDWAKDLAPDDFSVDLKAGLQETLVTAGKPSFEHKGVTAAVEAAENHLPVTSPPSNHDFELDVGYPDRLKKSSPPPAAIPQAQETIKAWEKSTWSSFLQKADDFYERAFNNPPQEATPYIKAATEEGC